MQLNLFPKFLFILRKECAWEDWGDKFHVLTNFTIQFKLCLFFVRVWTKEEFPFQTFEITWHTYSQHTYPRTHPHPHPHTHTHTHNSYIHKQVYICTYNIYICIYVNIYIYLRVSLVHIPISYKYFQLWS